jgi:F-type H+-transporting ATPase subunit a
MNNANMAPPELPNLVTLLEKALEGTPWAAYLALWENIIFSAILAATILTVFWLAARKKQMVPGRLQAAVEAFVGVADNFVCGIIGPKGRRFVPFIGTLFIYILSMNLFGLIPFMKSSTSSWSVTLALAVCVFVYLEYTAIRELGLFGYLDFLMEKPRGFLAFSVFIPLLMLFVHIVTELVKPVTLSLRLRSNIWGDDLLLAVLANLGLGGSPLLLFSSFLAIIAAFVQALVFCLLTTIYFALVLAEKE